MTRAIHLTLILALGGCGGHATRRLDTRSSASTSYEEADYAGGESVEPAYVQRSARAAESSPMPMSEGMPSAPTADTYADTPESPVHDTRQDNLATFSLDVDTASYTRMRAALTRGALPDQRSVRAEEYINFFDWSTPTDRGQSDAPFATRIETAPSPFGGQGTRLLRVDVQAIDVTQEERPDANLVFLVDTSGSMGARNKLPLLKYALTTLVDALRPTDTVGIVTYASNAGVLIPPTAVREREQLLNAINNLGAGGSTNGEGGIHAAYDLASQHFRRGGINRVILASDGDFNVGLTGNPLIELIERYRERDITLTALGFGTGNDRDMERLADHGNGMYAYIDNQSEAVRVLRDRLTGTLQVVAKDVKVQVEFDPELVANFRLIGYDNRILEHQDFENDQVDAGDVGAGQSATAYFEYTPRAGNQGGQTLATVRVRYKAPEGDVSKLVEYAVPARGNARFEQASSEFRFGVAVAEFAEVLRGSDHVARIDFGQIVEIAREAQWSQDEAPTEFIRLVENAAQIHSQRVAQR